MRGKFVWADGRLKTGEGMENSRKRPLHHVHILQAMIDEGMISTEPKNWIAGSYSFDPFMEGRITGKIDWAQGEHPSLDEVLEMIKEEKPKLSKFDYAATMEYLGANWEEYQKILDQYAGTPLQGYPGPVNVQGIGPLNFGAHSEIQDLAQQYTEAAGLDYNRPETYVNVNPDLASQIAWDYEWMEHNPDDPAVQESYDAFIRETMEQYKMITDAGYVFEFYPPNKDPYPNSPREAILDLYQNKHMYVFPTVEGYGSMTDIQNNPLLGDSGIKWGGRPVTYNDIFRAVHDFFGHAKEGVGFRADGEENAWRQHMYMYSEKARPAMTAETRGQNSWVNYGPYGELKNQKAKQEETIYADQKAGILPEWAFDNYAKTASNYNYHFLYPDTKDYQWLKYFFDFKTNTLYYWYTRMQDGSPTHADAFIEFERQMGEEMHWGLAHDLAERFAWGLETYPESGQFFPEQWSFRYADRKYGFYGNHGTPELRAYALEAVRQFVEANAPKFPQTNSKIAANEDYMLEVIKQTGGGTFVKKGSNFEPLYETQGYYVSVEGHEQQIPLEQVQPADLLNYANANVKPGELFGTWVDGMQLYLDVSKHFLDLNEALDFGKQNHQIAVWDAGNNQEIRLDKTSDAAIPAKWAWTLNWVEEKIAATSEDTEPVGKEVGFLQDPKDELYPCLFQGGTSIPQDTIDTLKNHVVEPLSERFNDPDAWIAFSIYGSGISYNWDDKGDLDIQMWVNMDEFLRYHDEDIDQDELLSEIRKIVQPINFPSFNDLGLNHDSCDGKMLIQYYPKPGTGSKEENLASKPYACYDLDKGIWLQKPITMKPKFYGETFLMLMPKAEEIAKQAEALLADYKRDILNWEFWDLLYRKHKKKEFKEQLDQTIKDAEQRKEGIINIFQSVFGDRAKAYSPEGRGVKDERDIMQKLLEVWGIFQELKHHAREDLPWETEIPESKESSLSKTAEWVDVVEKAQRYYAEGRVELLNNEPDHSIANVRGDTGTWQTEIWRQDPNRPNVLSGWSCTCPWGEHSWGRTRIWKRYEGRACAHVVVLSWESQRQPWTVDEEGNEQTQLFNPTQLPGRTYDEYLQDIPRQTPPSQLKTIQDIGQLELPGSFSSWIRSSGWFGRQFSWIYDVNNDEIWFGDTHTELMSKMIAGIDEDQMSDEAIMEAATDMNLVIGTSMDNGDITLYSDWDNLRGFNKQQAAQVIERAKYLAQLVDKHDLFFGSEVMEGYELDEMEEDDPKLASSETKVIDLPANLDIHPFDTRENPWRRTFIYAPSVDIVFLAPNNVYHTSIYEWLNENYPELYLEIYDEENSHGILEGNILYYIYDEIPEDIVKVIEEHLRKPLIQERFVPPNYWGGNDDYDPSEPIYSPSEQPWWDWNRTSAFLNGDFVRNKIKMIGMDDRGESYAVPRNTVGEVLYSDDTETIVIFNLKSGPLGAHLIRVEETTDKFMVAPKNILDRGPAPRRNAPNA